MEHWLRPLFLKRVNVRLIVSKILWYSVKLGELNMLLIKGLIMICFKVVMSYFIMITFQLKLQVSVHHYHQHKKNWVGKKVKSAAASSS